MQRLGELNNKVIVEQKTAPENKYVIWKDPVEGKFKEYKDGSWIESEEISVPGSPISPEDITPQILDDTDFRIRINLYGHTTEEVQALIEKGKCIRCVGKRSSNYNEEDASYLFEDNPPLGINSDTYLNHINIDIDYILICYYDSNFDGGLLLKKDTDGGDLYFRDVTDTFKITFDKNGDFRYCKIGYDSM